MLSPSFSVCRSVSLLRFTFYFLASPLCFSSCFEILLLTQFPLPPHNPLLFASLQRCLSCAAAYGMFPEGASDLVPGHGSCLHITGCTKVGGLGAFHLSHINSLRGCQGPDHKAKCIICAQ